MLDLIAGAYGVEGTEIVTTIAARWAHRLGDLSARQRVGAALRAKLRDIPIAPMQTVSMLSIDLEASSWTALASRTRKPVFILSGAVQAAVARWPLIAARNIEAASRQSVVPVTWLELVQHLREWVDLPCRCADCAANKG
jgi:hypothetical protein